MVDSSALTLYHLVNLGLSMEVVALGDLGADFGTSVTLAQGKGLEVLVNLSRLGIIYI